MDIQNWLENFEKESWNWDFKKCYAPESNDDDGISLFLKYKLGLLIDNAHSLKYTKIFDEKYIGINGDCDKEVYPMYNSLKWQIEFDDSIRGETMNSFTTTFHKAIILSKNKDEIYEEIGVNKNKYLRNQYEVLLKDKNYQKFSIIKNNLKEFECFAQLTHTIGNFTVLPNWMNTGRGGSFTVLDYWDLTLQSFYDFLLPLDAWRSFVEKYYLHSFLDKSLKPVEFWNGHFSGYAKINDESQIEQFLFRVNRSIADRGIYIKRKLNNEKNSEWPRSSEEIWTKENKLENLF